MSHIVSIATALPKHRYAQADLTETLEKFWSLKHFNPARVGQMHRAVQVEERFLALSKEEYQAAPDFTERNTAFLRVATDLGEMALSQALAAIDMAPQRIDAVFFTTVTGLAVPTVDAALVNRLKLRRDVKRIPMFGLGCVGGAAGIARVHDYLQAYPDHVAVLLSVELCSLTMQFDDLSIPNLISTGLFGDGACALIVAGDEALAAHGLRSQARVRASRSAFYYNTERVMGWDIGSHGFKVVLSSEVPSMVQRFLREDIEGFLFDRGMNLKNIDSWICHPGGPKVLDALRESLQLDEKALALTWQSLARIGNLSSASVLFVLKDTLDSGALADPSRRGIVLALGPGFCSEIVLLEGGQP